MCAAVSLLLLVLVPAAATAAPEPVELSVGVGGRLEEVVLPGPRLEAAPRERDAAFVVRVVATRPHGTAFRYDLAFYGLEAGTYDVGDYLMRADGSPAEGLPPLPVAVADPLLPGEVEPADPEAGPAPAIGGYTALAWGAGAAWVLAGAALVLLRRGRRRAAAAAAGPPPPTLAERLRPLVEEARAGRLDAHGQARLERLLLGVWRQRLGLEDLGAAEALARLRAHDEAGALLRQLEAWLHQPPGRGAKVDVEALLAPYADRAHADRPHADRPHTDRQGVA